jgi:hypothetical protein
MRTALPMSMWWIFGVTAGGMLGVLFLFGRRNERAVRRDWELLLTPKGEKVYQNVEARMQSNIDLAELTYDEAFTFRELGSLDEAKHLLDVGFRVIEQFSPSMLRLLSAMATFSRMVSAMAPVSPLRPAGFKLAQLASLAYLNQFLHQFLVSTGERFRLKVYVLGRGFGLATRFLLQSTERIASNAPESDREWEQIEALRADFQTLTDESLASLRVLLTTLSAEKHENILDKF